MKKYFLSSLFFIAILFFSNFSNSMELEPGEVKDTQEEVKKNPDLDAYSLIFLNNTNKNIEISYAFDDDIFSKTIFIRRVLAPQSQIIIKDIKKLLGLSFIDYGDYYQVASTQKPIILDNYKKKIIVITFDNSYKGYKIIDQVPAKIAKPESGNPKDFFIALKTRLAYASWLYSFIQNIPEEKEARYILGLIDNPTKVELEAAYKELKDTYNLENLENINFYGADFLKKVNDLIDHSYENLNKNIDKYEVEAKKEIESKEDFANFENLTKNNVYIANYIVTKSGGASRLGDLDEIIKIGPGQSKIIKLPFAGSGVISIKFFDNTKRRVIASENKSDLKSEIIYGQYKNMARANIGPLPFIHPRKFYIQQDNKRGLIILDKWTMGQKEYANKHPEFQEKVNKLVSNYEHKNETDKVEFGQVFSEEKEIFKDELNYLEKRKKTKIVALEKLLDRKINEKTMPSIALVFTGGGYRALVATIGYLLGAEQIGLLDAVDYMTGLSGSTWAITAFVSSGLDIQGFAAFARDRINDPSNHIMTKDVSSLAYSVVESLKDKFEYWPKGLISYFGASIANSILPGDVDQRQQMTLSSLSKNLESGKYPFPILTAINPTNPEKPIWFEFSPYRIGTFQNSGSWIRTPFLSRIFENRVTKNSTPEYPLSYLMGIWGSAMSFSIDRALDKLNLKWITNPLANSISKIGEYPVINYIKAPEFITKYLPTSQTRVVEPLVPNFLYKVKDSEYSDKETIPVVDGGHDFLLSQYTHNFSSVPVLWRKVDVLIMCDAKQEEPSGAKHLRASELRAHSLGLKFPKIDYTNIDSKTAVLFKDDQDDDTPIIVYMAAKKNNDYDPFFDPAKQAFTNTTNFYYTNDQFDKFSGLTKYIMSSSKPLIINAINEAIKRKETVFKQANKSDLYKAVESGDAKKVSEILNTYSASQLSEIYDFDDAYYLAQQNNREDIVNIFLEYYRNLLRNLNNNLIGLNGIH